MKAIALLIWMGLFAGCIHTSPNDFVQGSIRITPPVQKTWFRTLEDGGTTGGTLADARGRTYDFYIDHRLGTKTPGAFYLKAYPAEWRSVRVKNEAEFKQKLGF